jgi:hypothetical protein
MGYTISWEPLRFTDFTYETVLSVVRRVISARLRVEHCGFLIGDDDDSCVAFARDGIQTPWEKTNRMPYTKEAMKALIVMVEYGVTENLDHDDSDMAWYLEALDAVHAKHPLVSYEQQRQYFVNLETTKRAMS